MAHDHYGINQGSVIGGSSLLRSHDAAIKTIAEQARICETSVEQPQLSITSERLHYCIQDLSGAVGALEARLDPVLNPDMTAKCGQVGPSAPDPIRCPIGKSMDARSQEVFEITERVRRILDRLAC